MERTKDSIAKSLMWDARFASEDFVFGREPAVFLVEQAGILAPGSRVLAVSEGEGRNSVWLAGRGHHVTAFDISPVAVEKAQGLAAELGVSVDFQVASAESWDWSQSFDAIAAIFIQYAAPDLRTWMFGKMAEAITPGGLLLLHGYAPRQVEYGTGGPPFVENMYTLDMLREAFAGWEVLRAEDYDRDLDEGPGHSGTSGLIDFIARKPA